MREEIDNAFPDVTGGHVPGERGAFEEINPTERNGIFTINSKAYYMVKIPAEMWDLDWDVFRRVK